MVTVAGALAPGMGQHVPARVTSKGLMGPRMGAETALQQQDARYSGYERRLVNAALHVLEHQFGVAAGDILNRPRGPYAVTMPYRAMVYVLCEQHRLTNTALGALIGRDHSTIAYHRVQARRLAMSDQEFRSTTEVIAAGIAVALDGMVPSTAEMERRQMLNLLRQTIATCDQVRDLARSMGEMAALLSRSARLHAAAIESSPQAVHGTAPVTPLR